MPSDLELKTAVAVVITPAINEVLPDIISGADKALRRSQYYLGQFSPLHAVAYSSTLEFTIKGLGNNWFGVTTKGCNLMKSIASMMLFAKKANDEKSLNTLGIAQKAVELAVE